MSDKEKLKNSERLEYLMMAAVDGELNPDEQRELDAAIAESPEIEHELNEYKRLKQVTGSMEFKSPPQEMWDFYWLNIFNKIERSIAWLIFSFGCMIILTYFGFQIIEHIINNPHLAIVVKIGLLCMIGGMAILAVSVIREKLYLRKSDPYREIKR